MQERALKMTSKTGVQKSTGDTLKWIIALTLLVAGVVANTYLQELAVPLRIAGGIVLLLVSGALISQTKKGREIWVLAKDSRMELRKVVWPSRQETIRFTIGVVIMVIIMSFALWLIDTALLWIVKLFTG